MNAPLRELPKSSFDPSLARGAPGFRGDWGTALWVRAGCAHRCVFCHGYREAVPPSTFEELRSFLERPGKGARRLLLYGEPLLHPRVLDILALARGLGFTRLEAQSSGEELADRGFARALAAAGLSSVSIPLYARGSLHDRIVGRPGSRALLSRALTNLAGLKGVETWVHSVLMNVNLGEMGALRKEIEGRGMPFCVLPLHPKAEVRGVEKLLCSHREVVARYEGTGLGLVGFPLCALGPVDPKGFARIAASRRDPRKECHRKVEKGISDITFGYTRMFKTVQGRACRGCAVRRLCPGVFARHLERFGEGDLRPFASCEGRRP